MIRPSGLPYQQWRRWLGQLDGFGNSPRHGRGVGHESLDGDR